MKKFINLREAIEADSAILLEWRNDKTARKNSFSSDRITEKEHQRYMAKLQASSSLRQFIFEYNGMPVGAIREQLLEEMKFKLSYQISPLYGGKKLGQIMMSLYLIDRSGSFICEVKEGNISSIKMIEKLGFIKFKTENKVNSYNLQQP